LTDFPSTGTYGLYVGSKVGAGSVAIASGVPVIGFGTARATAKRAVAKKMEANALGERELKVFNT
jgi:hypothetical protein